MPTTGNNYPYLGAAEDVDLQDVLAECLVSSQFAAKTLFPDTFEAPWSGLHNQIFDLIDSDERQIVIAAPRGLGKTSIAKLKASIAILFRLYHFIVYVSKSATYAEMQSENIKRALLANQEVKELFGSVKVASNPDVDPEFSKVAWTAFGEVFVLPRGAGQQVRGSNWNDFRPELIIVDDLEDKKLVQNEDNRKYLKEWFFSDLLKSVNMYKKNWRVIYIDTIKHEDSLLADLLEAPDWAKLNLSLMDDNFNSLAPDYMTTEEIKKEYRSHEEKGLTEVFFMEYCNIPTPKVDASFQVNKFKHYSEVDYEFLERLHGGKIETITIMDPAKTVKMHSAESAIVTVGIDAEACRYYVRHVFGEKVRPGYLIEMLFDIAVRFNATAVGIEVTSLHDWIMQPIKNYMHKMGGAYYKTLIELTASRSKEERIRELVPFYDQGQIYHEVDSCMGLEKQLMAFPKSKLWDKMDCLAYLPKMLELGARYFNVPASMDDPYYEYTSIGISQESLTRDWRIA